MKTIREHDEGGKTAAESKLIQINTQFKTKHKLFQ